MLNIRMRQILSKMLIVSLISSLTIGLNEKNASAIDSSVIKSVSAGYYGSFLLMDDDSLWATGSNDFGVLGNGGASVSNWEKVLTNVQQIESGTYHSLALKNDGTVWATGKNDFGQLGDGTTTDEWKWIQVLTDVKQISVGENFSLALKNDGTVWATGTNDFGQLGDGTTTNSKTWKQVLTDVKQISAGEYHSVALKNDGTVWTTGYNNNGQLADGTKTESHTWKQVLIGVSQVSAGGRNTFAIKQNGDLVGVGSNFYGGLGDGTTKSFALNWESLLTDVKQISTSGSSTLALKNDGTVWGCGWNAYNELGDGTTTNTNHWKQVFSDVKQVSAQNYFSFALKNDGGLWGTGNISNSNHKDIWSYIDTVDPSLSLSQNTTDAIIGTTVTLTANASDNVGVTQIKTPDGNIINGSTANYDVTQDGTYKFIAYDKAGNTTTKSITIAFKPDLKGTITVKYIDENGNPISDDTLMNNLDLKNYTISAKTIDGYKLNDDSDKTVSLTDSDNNEIVTFNYIKQKNESTTPSGVTVTTPGSITVKYIDQEDKPISDDTIMDNLELKDYTVSAKTIDGYDLNDISGKTVTLNDSNRDVTVNFKYKREVSTTTPPAVTPVNPPSNTNPPTTIDLKGSITIKYVDENNNSLAPDSVMSDLELKDYNVSPIYTIWGYKVKGDNTVPVTLTTDNKDKTVVFKYVPVVYNYTYEYLQCSNGSQLYLDPTGQTNAIPDLSGEIPEMVKGNKYVYNIPKRKNFELVSATSNLGVFNEDKSSITFDLTNTMPSITYPQTNLVYKAKADIVVHYVDKQGNKIADDTVQTFRPDFDFEHYYIDLYVNQIKKLNVSTKSIDGYTLLNPEASNVDLHYFQLTDWVSNDQFLSWVGQNDDLINSIQSGKLSVGVLPEVTFVYDKNTTAPTTPVDTKGTITVKYVDENNTLIAENTVMNDLAIKNYTVSAKTIDGYDLNDTADKTVTLTQSDNNQIVIFSYKKKSIEVVTPPITTNPIPTPSHSSDSSSHHNSEIRLIDVYKNDYIKNTDTKVSENNYNWNNTTDNLTGTLEYTDNCYTIKMDKDFDKGTHIVIYDNFKGKPAKLYSYIPDIGMYALLKDDVTSTDGTLKFDTTHKGEYVITANELPKDKVLKYWYSLGYNKWIFFNKYSDERLIGWHKADKGEWVHNGIDSMGDSFHMGDNTIMDMGWFKDKDGSWYYLDNLSRDGINSYGAVLKGWYYLDNNWYYFNLDSGKMTTGWCKINNNWYYFKADGAMQANTTIDGYQLNEHGQLI